MEFSTHITSSPCYPQSNDDVRRAVQSATTLTKKAKEAGEDCYFPLLNQPKRLQPLESGVVVRVISKDGFRKKGIIVRKAQHPQSYVVEYGNRDYRRNHGQIIEV
ncbi:Hypothetical predicted protein [Paramuricea clavata]|uniref:Uncharacterized protein n=1 Tax=Paramuricea clavata TaxID=317549 RepID=A0A7D9JAY9_PARCT|nr:Hypothetical predicted protein [Paramuricea clavata]